MTLQTLVQAVNTRRMEWKRMRRCLTPEQGGEEPGICLPILDPLQDSSRLETRALHVGSRVNTSDSVCTPARWQCLPKLFNKLKLPLWEIHSKIQVFMLPVNCPETLRAEECNALEGMEYVLQAGGGGAACRTRFLQVGRQGCQRARREQCSGGSGDLRAGTAGRQAEGRCAGPVRGPGA